MKRKLISIFLFMFVGILLAGCEFFGGQTTQPTTIATGTYFDVVFFDGDESILETQEVLEGEAADEPDTPTKTATAQYTYTFDHWDQDYSSVTADLLIYPVFTASVNQYTVTFYDEDETTVLGTSTVPYGTAATAPANPSKADDGTNTYVFNGWSGTFSNVIANKSVHATYASTALESYTVNFYNDDGVLIVSRLVVDGGDALPPTEPTKADTAQYTFAFAGWDIAYTNVTEDLDVYATYTETLRSYTVTFFNEDGFILKDDLVPYGSAAIAPANPTYGPTAQYTYTFTGWDVDFTNIVGNLDVTAEYTSVVNEYDVTFYNEDGTVIITESVEYGGEATAPADPTYGPTAQYTYTFTGWDEDFTNIVGDLGVTALYSTVVNSYTVEFMDYDGTVFDTQVIEYGSPAVEPDNPFKPSDESNAYAFMYWDANFDSIVSDTIINPVFNAVPLSTEYVVNFYNAFGDIISSQNIVHGEDAIAPITNPEKMSDSQYDYTFTGWDTDFTSVNQDLDILPLFDKILRTYTVNFYDHDGVTILDTQTIDFGAAATAPTAPQKPDDAEWSYTFIGWDSNFNQISDDLDVYPVYIKTSLSVFDRADLVDMVNLMFEDPDNVETIITMLTGMFSAVSEEALYHDLSIVNQMMDELNNISSASDIQDMFTAIQALGFNKDKIISIFYGFVLIQLNDDIAKMQEEITYKQVTAPSADHCGSRVSTQFSRPGSGLYRAGNDSHVFRPMTTAAPDVRARKRRESSGIRHGSVLPMPIAPCRSCAQISRIVPAER